MLKYFASPPVIALFAVLVLRGLSAQPGEDVTAQATAPTNATTTSAPSSGYMQFARLTFDEGVRSAVNARAMELFAIAQSQGNALDWIDKHCRAVAGDIAFQQQSLGVVTGEAQQFSELLNRAGELAACGLAQHWLATGSMAQLPAAVNLDPILEKYSQVYSNESNESTDEAEQ